MIPASNEVTKTLIFKSSDVLKPFGSLAMTIGIAVAHVEALLGDLLQLQASLGATKNIVYLPADVLKIVGGHFVPSLVPFEYPSSSIAWAAAFIIIGLLLGLLLMSKRGDENGQKT